MCIIIIYLGITDSQPIPFNILLTAIVETMWCTQRKSATWIDPTISVEVSPRQVGIYIMIGSS